MEPKPLDKETLHSLYWTEDLDFDQIAKLYGKSHNAIRKCFYKFGLKTRHGIEIRARAGIHKRPSPNLSYLIGVMFGDGNVCANGADKKPRMARLKVADEAFAISFGNAATSLGYRVHQFTTSQLGRTYYTAAFHSIDFATWWKTAPQADKLSLAAVYPDNFIRGLYEAEGSVFLKNDSRRITINMGDFPTMCYIDGLLRGMGFPTNLRFIRARNIVPMIRIEISGDASVQLFLDRFRPIIKNTPGAWQYRAKQDEVHPGVCREQVVPTPPVYTEGEDMFRSLGKPKETGRNDLSISE